MCVFFFSSVLLLLAWNVFCSFLFWFVFFVVSGVFDRVFGCCCAFRVFWLLLSLVIELVCFVMSRFC